VWDQYGGKKAQLQQTNARVVEPMVRVEAVLSEKLQSVKTTEILETKVCPAG
jgi:hypothetical protein